MTRSKRCVFILGTDLSLLIRLHLRCSSHFKVRCLWSTIDGVLSSTKEEQRVVESVLKGDVDQYVLDGKDRILKIPRSLQERVEQLPHQVRVVPKSALL